MITKTTKPILSDVMTQTGNCTVIGTKVEYRFFGILLYKKILYNPGKYGLKHWDHYQTSI